MEKEYFRILRIFKTNYKFIKFIIIVGVAYTVGYILGQGYSNYIKG